MYDVFISHAAEDKERIADPLMRELVRRGLTVWYDTERISLGDDLRTAIDEGLTTSRYGVVLISPIFLQKSWTIAELGGLMATTGRAGRILPVLHDLSPADLARTAPTLSGKAFASTTEGLRAVCDKICRAVQGNASSRTVDAPRVHILSNDLRQSLMHTRCVVRFEAGFPHELVYEREDKFILGAVVRVAIDGTEIFHDGWKAFLGRTSRDFAVEKIPGKLRIIGAGFAIWVSVGVGGVSLLQI